MWQLQLHSLVQPRAALYSLTLARSPDGSHSLKLRSIGADTMGHSGARAPPLLICRGHGGAQITVMKRKWISLEDDRQFAHSIWKYEQHLYNVIFVNSSFHFDGCAPRLIPSKTGWAQMKIGGHQKRWNNYYHHCAPPLLKSFRRLCSVELARPVLLNHSAFTRFLRVIPQMNLLAS